MFDPIRQKPYAKEVAFLLENVTGDKTRIVGVGGSNGVTQWVIERFTGTIWVRG